MLPLPLFLTLIYLRLKRAQFCYKQKYVFQGEKVLNFFFHVHCELRSILLLVKTAKKRGVIRMLPFFAITLVMPLPPS